MDEQATISDLERRLAKAETALCARDERLRESEARHRLIIESWAQAVWETNAHGVVIADSPSWRAYTGQTFEEWRGYGWLDAIHPDDRAYAERQWREAVEAHELVNAEFRLRAPDGGWRWTNVRAAPVLDADGEIGKWVGLNIDIDGRKQAEASLRESEQHRRIALESGGMGAWRWDLASGRVWGDGALLSMWGFPPSTADIRYDSFTDRISEEGAKELAARIAEAVEAGESFEGDLEVIGGPTKGRWVRWRGRADPLQPTLLQGVSFDITERRAAETALRASEERQAFLLALSDALRPLRGPVDVQRTAVMLLGDHLGVDRAYYAEIDEQRGDALVHDNYLRGSSPSLIGVHRLVDYGWVAPLLRHGKPVVITNANSTLQIPAADREAMSAARIAAAIYVPLVKDSALVGALSVTEDAPREWDEMQIGLVREVAERTWAAVERSRAETALRESEERFAQFANASAAGLWIRDADTLAMEFVSSAIATIYGVEPDALLGDATRWAAMIIPEDRDVALSHLEAARRGGAVAHEFRIQRPSDNAFRWIRNTDFPLRDDGHIPRIGGIAEDVTEARLAAEHSAVLLAELQHRVRNIMALLRSITNRTAERAEGVSEYRDLMLGRLLAFARVQALLTRTANVSVGIASIVHDEVSAQAQHEGQYVLDGPDVALSPKAAEVLTLAIHELATNAVKYGALCVPDGKVTVSWSTFERRGGPWLAFDWTEEGAPKRPEPAPEAPRRRGFGLELIEGRIPYELRGRGQVIIEPGGARCHLEFPLRGGASILETSAPQRATVFGGAIDMTGEPDLTGRHVLVVEDDYYLATDAARALRGAGAEVMGPCATAEDARAELEERRPDAAVLDINLGLGPSFKLAEHLKDRGIPFVFKTGYDAEVIPAEFEEMERLVKPLQLRQIVGAIARLTTAA